uniref:Uncharacterized protein n=1 Tax=Rhizophora mucronata TaxID=61149 RepID=A0A2P2JM44_RHIMU
MHYKKHYIAKHYHFFIKVLCNLKPLLALSI